MFAKLTGCLLLLLAFGAAQAKADSVFEVIGSLTIPGNSANPGVGETINYSFQLDYATSNGYPTSSIVGTPTITSYGPLGSYFMNTGYLGQANGYVAFFSGPLVNGYYSSEIDLGGFFTQTYAPQPEPFQGKGAAYIWSCFAPLPCSEFAPVGAINPNGGSGLVWYNGSTNTSAVYVVSTPEPGTLGLFALGALALCLMKKTLTH